jgi:hypothetical protein
MNKYISASIVALCLSCFATFTQASMCQNYTGVLFNQCQCNFWPKSFWCTDGNLTSYSNQCPGGYNQVKGVCTPPPSLKLVCPLWTDMYQDCIINSKNDPQCTKKGVVQNTCATNICNQNIQQYQAEAKACKSKK